MAHRISNFTLGIRHTLVLLVLVLGHSLSTNLNAETILYRYKNEHGVQVINHSIPANYAQKGYEVINSSGEVLQVIPAAPSQDEIAEANRQRDILNTYKILKRRYSTIEDIQGAKERKLANIETNISILKGNIGNLESAVADIVSRAADIERAGRSVPKALLDQLTATKAELKISGDLLRYREQEFKEVSLKYDSDISAFIQGELLEKQLKAKPAK